MKDRIGRTALGLSDRTNILNRAAIEALEERRLLTTATMDFGDAPDSYSTLLASNGARHAGPSALFLGTRRDAESDGHPSALANGDDTDPAGQLDDEDGVTLPSPIPGTQATASVVASTVGKLDAFVDFNGDGDFADASEKIFDSVPVVAGNNVLHYDVPRLSKSGKIYARFRISTAGGLSFNGAAADGEVEDHLLNVKPLYDFGDAPESYGTLIKDNGPQHALSPLFLGDRIDNESDGQPDDDATGDDFGPLGQPTDEDGVNIPALVLGQDVKISVISSGAGKLDAWVDFNADGAFSDYYYDGEQVLVSVPVVAGNNELTIHVPDFISAKTTFARFRLSSEGNLTPHGVASDGEVEDYAVTFDFGEDFGDAPDSYHTLLASDGPRHKLGGTISFGSIDADPDGQPSVDAQGDDINSNDDEDSFLPNVVPGDIVSFRINSGSEAFVDGWIDFNGNGQFDSSEKVLDKYSNFYYDEVQIEIPDDAKIGTTYARFRISSVGGLTPTGEAPDGEVEDIQFHIIENVDYGDAPDSYQTLLASNGPRHLQGSGLYLGDSVDSDFDGQPTDDASGDDNSLFDDEDGFSLNDLAIGAEASAIVYASAPGKIDAFIDYNQDGDFTDVGEKVINSASVDAGENTLPINVPVDAIEGYTFARFRISSAGNLGPGGEAADGEVEDERVFVRPVPADLTITEVTAPATAKVGGNITYTYTVDNIGKGDAYGVEFSTYVPEGATFVSLTVPDDWTINTPSVGDFGSIYIDRNQFLASDEPQVFELVVKVNPDVPDGTNFNNASYFESFHDDEVNLDNNAGKATTTITSAAPAGIVSVIADPADGTKTALRITGTDKTEKIEIAKSGSSQGKAVVKIDGKNKGTFSFSGHVIVFGGAGNDTISIDPAITRGTFVFGEAGKDTVNGGGGSDVIVGGDSSDKLSGRGGRDLLFGGGSADSLSGGDADDILLAGKSDFDTNLPSLAKLQKEWIRTDKTYAQRVTNIKNGTGLTGGVKLAKSTADSTATSIDSLKGDAGSDLFFANLVATSGKPKDLLQDKSASETSIDLD